MHLLTQYNGTQQDPSLLYPGFISSINRTCKDASPSELDSRSFQQGTDLQSLWLGRHLINGNIWNSLYKNICSRKVVWVPVFDRQSGAAHRCRTELHQRASLVTKMIQIPAHSTIQSIISSFIDFVNVDDKDKKINIQLQTPQDISSSCYTGLSYRIETSDTFSTHDLSNCSMCRCKLPCLHSLLHYLHIETSLVMCTSTALCAINSQPSDVKFGQSY